VSNWLYSYDWCQAPAPTLAPSRSRNADEHQPRPLGLASAQLGTILDQASAVCWGSTILPPVLHPGVHLQPSWAGRGK
jgi:hypothetical protein